MESPGHHYPEIGRLELEEQLALTYRQYNYLTSVEFATNKENFYRWMDIRGRPGPAFGGDSSLRFHTASFLFSPAESATVYTDDGNDEGGYQSVAEDNLLPHLPVVAAVGSKSPSFASVLDSWNRKQLPKFLRRVTIQRSRIEHNVMRHLTHKNLKDALTTRAKLDFLNKERWERGELTNQMSMLGDDRYTMSDESLPILTLGAPGGHNAIYACLGLRSCTPLIGNTFRIRLHDNENIKDIVKLISDTNDKIVRSNKYQTPLFVALYLESGDEAIWRQKPLPFIYLPGTRETQAFELPIEDEPVAGGGTVYVAGLSATLNLKYITTALESLGISESNKPNWATTITETYDEEVVYIEVDVHDIDESSSKTFNDSKKDVQVNVLRASEMSKGY